MFNQNEVVDLDDATRQRLTAIRNRAPSMFTESDGTLQTLEDMYREEQLLASFSAFQLEEASKPTAERLTPKEFETHLLDNVAMMKIKTKMPHSFLQEHSMPSGLAEMAAQNNKAMASMTPPTDEEWERFKRVARHEYMYHINGAGTKAYIGSYVCELLRKVFDDPTVDAPDEKYNTTSFAINDTVAIHGLQSAAGKALNGKHVLVTTSLNKKGRHGCTLVEDVAQKRSIKASNLTHTKATTLQRKLKYYETTLRASNATQSFIDKVIERASDVATCDQFEVPMVFGFKNHTVAVKHGPEKGQFLPDVICSVIHALNHELLFASWPNGSPCGFESSARLRTQLSNYNACIQDFTQLLALNKQKYLQGFPIAFAKQCQTTHDQIQTAMCQVSDTMLDLTTTSCCAHCGKTKDEVKKLSLCSGCKSLMYCSTICQRTAWPDHKKQCKQLTKGGRHGGQSKARAVQIVKELRESSLDRLGMTDISGRLPAILNVLALMTKENGQYNETRLKELKWAYKLGVIECFRDVVTVDDDLHMKRVENRGGRDATLFFASMGSSKLLGLLLERNLSASGTPVPHIEHMCTFMNDGTECKGFWNMITQAYTFYHIVEAEADSRARYIVRVFHKIFAISKVARLMLPSLTKKRCKMLVFLGVHAEKVNSFDAACGMSYLALSLVGCVLAQARLNKDCLPKDYKEKWLLTHALKREQIFHVRLLPMVMKGVRENRLFTNADCR